MIRGFLALILIPPLMVASLLACVICQYDEPQT